MSAWKDDSEERITEVIRDNLDEKAPFITGWVLVATYSDDDGETCTAFNGMEGQRRTQTLGMLTHVIEHERACVFWEAQR